MEVIARRIYALFQAFKHVEKLGDWKRPSGAPKSWKRKVQWGLADEYDLLASDQGELRVDEADDEGRRWLEKKAFFAKYFVKAQVSSEQRAPE